MFGGCATIYVYYSTVYSTIQDVVEPSLRGTAMALYFFAMYVLGASLGPVGMGFLSDFFSGRAARVAGVTDTGFDALKPFAAEGLHSALFILPMLAFLLAVVLFAASRTVTSDVEKLQKWMRESGTAANAEKAAVQVAK
jgi:MFS family permease